MTAESSRPVQDRWCDIDGAHLSLFCWVEQVAASPEPGALPSRLHQRGEVVGRGPDVLYVRFQGEGQLISVPPHLLRLLPGLARWTSAPAPMRIRSDLPCPHHRITEHPS